MTSITDILYNGLIEPSNTTYDIELYLNTILEKYLFFNSLLKSSNFDKIKEYIELYNNILTFHNFYFRNRIYPIDFLFMNNNLTIEMIDFFINKNFELTYINEDKLITFYLLKNIINESNKIDILKYLKSINYDFNLSDSEGNNTLHYLSTYSCDNNILFELVESFYNNINLLNKGNSSPLLLATNYNNVNYIEFLLSKGANVNLSNSNGNTCLMYACMNNNFNIVKKLIEKGAKVNAKDSQLDSPFMYACGCDNKGELNLEIIKILNLHLNNAERNNINIEKYNALHYAAGCITKKPNLEVIKYLIEIDINQDLLDNKNKTYIDYIIEYEQDKDKVLNFLKDINLSLNIKNNLIINDYEYLLELNLFKFCMNKIECSICNICHDIPENKIIKCKNNHYFDYECIIKWFKESNKTECPLCFQNINLTEIYFIN